MADPDGRLDKTALRAPLQAMTLTQTEKLVVDIRDHYVAQFRGFVEQQREKCSTGGPEVRFSLPEESEAFRRLIIVDFVRNDTGPEAVFFEPEMIVAFDGVDAKISQTNLSIDGLRWDEVSIRHDAPNVETRIEGWFVKWLDPDDSRFDPSSDISNCIHSVYINGDELQIDLGTAPAEAFWELLVCLADAHASFIRVE